jgi:hypothetical protein
VTRWLRFPPLLVLRGFEPRGHLARASRLEREVHRDDDREVQLVPALLAGRAVALRPAIPAPAIPAAAALPAALALPLTLALSRPCDVDDEVVVVDVDRAQRLRAAEADPDELGVRPVAANHVRERLRLVPQVRGGPFDRLADGLVVGDAHVCRVLADTGRPPVPTLHLAEDVDGAPLAATEARRSVPLVVDVLEQRDALVRGKYLSTLEPRPPVCDSLSTAIGSSRRCKSRPRSAPETTAVSIG